ncbi:CRISPR-associated endonuclease Cas2 [Rhodothalassium salexigens]|nr:CRISPR-associated endonuclease Cas2 [Rhodothalassium salexigens]MBK5920727.1 CRISPR-associated endonuclease Cas2 [Rhodothalassium salexigens]
MLSGYRMMWLYVMFDLPVLTPDERRRATRFRKTLLDCGFEMAQFSVYLRFCESKETAETHIRKVQSVLPPAGCVHIITITDKQYGNARIFQGTMQKRPPENPDQLVLL